MLPFQKQGNFSLHLAQLAAMGAFQGQISPLSGRSIFEQCVIPIFLYGSENWFLTEPLLRMFEAFQEEIGRRILRLTRFHSGRAVHLALSWPSMASRLLQRKLLFLQQVMSTERIVSHQLLHGLLSSPTTPIQLIDGCLFLEPHLGLSGLVGRVKEASITAESLKKEILRKDKETLLTLSLEHQSTSIASRIAEFEESSWLKLWDIALDWRPAGTAALRSLYKEMTRLSWESASCLLCQECTPPNKPYFEHFITAHSTLDSVESVCKTLTSANPDFSPLIRQFKTL